MDTYYEDAWLWWPTAVLANSRNVGGYNVNMLLQYGEGYIFPTPSGLRTGARDDIKFEYQIRTGILLNKPEGQGVRPV